jgi:hypothetical protein
LDEGKIQMEKISDFADSGNFRTHGTRFLLRWHRNE